MVCIPGMTKGCGPLYLGGAIFDRWRNYLMGPLGPTPRPSSDPQDTEIKKAKTFLENAQAPKNSTTCVILMWHTLKFPKQDNHVHEYGAPYSQKATP